jgi:hypothetical protein
VRVRYLKLALLFIAVLVACSPVSPPEILYDPAALQFSGERAFEVESQFVAQFPNRHSGQPNNRLAAEWLLEQFSGFGFDCAIDEWQIVNYSQSVPLNNVVCRLPGESAKEILVVAHHDQAPTTVEGADNDASGISILLQLAEIFAAEAPHPYTLVFVSTDAEEYGMLGSRRYVETHPNTNDILAGISLDNLGRDYYNGMNMELIGQFREYGPIWLALTTRAVADASQQIVWDVNLRAPLDQLLDQAGPISFMDQGPIVAAGVPAIGLAAHVPPEFAELHYHLWHDPDDTMEHQSPASLGQSGLIAEALIRQLLSMDSFPQESGPYLYFDSSQAVLRGAPLWLVFIAFAGLFLASSYFIAKAPLREKLQSWRAVLPHFLSLWLPLLATLLLLYLMVALRLMDEYHLYPATSKDPLLYNPRWPAVVIFLLGLGAFFFLARRWVRRVPAGVSAPSFAQVRSFAFFVIGLAALYVLAINPFSLLFFVPLLLWFLIKPREGASRYLNILLFILGGLVVYALIYFFGFVIFDYNFAFLWFLLNMFSIQMISLPTAAAITAIIAAGLSLLIFPQKG